MKRTITPVTCARAALALLTLLGVALLLPSLANGQAGQRSPRGTLPLLACDSCSAGPASTPTPTASATSSPSATPVSTPTPDTAITFGPGRYAVGSAIAAGTYRARTPGAACHWQRLGAGDSVIAADVGNWPMVVTIAPSDLAFHSDGCGTWTSDLSAITTSATAPFGEGTMIVGTDIAAGTWRTGGAGACFWARLSSFSGEEGSVIAAGLASGPETVTIAPTDRGFHSSGCATWTRVV